MTTKAEQKQETTAIIIGFESSGSVAVTVSAQALEALEKALPAAGWHDLPTEDGNLKLNLARVIYLRTERQEQTVGFSV